jgi:hypothetical protein
MTSPDTYESRIGYSKLEDINLQPWGNIAVSVIENFSAGSMPNITITGFNNGGYLISWLNNYNIYGGYVNSQGMFQSELGGSVLVSKCKDDYCPIQMGNEMYFAWNDFKAANFSYYPKEIRMQKFANITYVGNSDEVYIPTGLLSCYPNPFNSILTIDVNTASKGKTTVSVYNLKGQKVTTITDEILDKGRHTFTWNGRDYKGKSVSSGIYYLRVSGEQDVSLAKILFMK